MELKIRSLPWGKLFVIDFSNPESQKERRQSQGRGEIQNYYQKKVAEGKNKMMVINAVRNKLIHRIFAVVRENRVYQKNYQYHLIKP